MSWAKHHDESTANSDQILFIFLLCKIAVKSSENLVTYQLTLPQLKLSSLCQMSPWVLISSSESVAGLRRKTVFANDVPITVRSTDNL